MSKFDEPWALVLLVALSLFGIVEGVVDFSHDHLTRGLIAVVVAAILAFAAARDLNRRRAP